MRFFKQGLSLCQFIESRRRSCPVPTSVVAEVLERRLQFSSAFSLTDPNGQPVTSATVGLPTLTQSQANTPPTETFQLKNEDSATALPQIEGGVTYDFTGALPNLDMSVKLTAGAITALTLTLNNNKSPGVYTDIIIVQNIIKGFQDFETEFQFTVTETILPDDLGVIGSNPEKPPVGVVSAAFNPDGSSNPHPSQTSEFAQFEIQGAANQVMLSVTSNLMGTTDNTGVPNVPTMNLAVQVLYAGNATQPDNTLSPVANSYLILDTTTRATTAGAVWTATATGSVQLGPLPAGTYFVTFSPANVSPTFGGSATETYTYGLSAIALDPTISVAFGGEPIAFGATTANGTNFGNVNAGADPVVKIYSITNTGNGDLTLDTPTLGGSAFDVEQNPPATISPGQTATFEIGLLTNTAGQKNDTVSLPTNVSGENPFTFAISGTVIATNTPFVEVFDDSRPIVNAQPSAIDFGNPTLGDTRPTQTFTVQNSGSAALTTGAVSVPAGFTLISALAGSIAANSSATFTVELDTSAAGHPAGQITFTTNDPNAANFGFPIVGTVKAAPMQELSITAVTTQKIAATVVGGSKKAKGQVLIILQNISGELLSGPVNVTVFASSSKSSVVTVSLPALGQMTARLKKLKVGKTQKVSVKVMFPHVPVEETFYLVAQATGVGVTLQNGIIAAAPNQVTVSA